MTTAQRALGAGVTLLLAWAAPPALADQAPAEIPEDRTLRVSTKAFEPFVFRQNDEWVGFSIDLWREVARELDLDYEYVGTDSVPELLDTLRDGTADVAVAGLTITAEREMTVDFSYPFYQSGLQIMVASDRQGGVTDVIAGFFSPALLKLLGGLLIVLLVAAHLLWFFERKRNPDMFPKNYFRGIWEALWWASVTVTTVGYGDKTPLGVGGRIVALIWMFSGIVLISYFTATVTTVLTMQQLSGSIGDPADLPGKEVGTARGSTAAQWLYDNAADVREFDEMREAYAALRAGVLDAVVYDSPVLRYHASREGRGRVRVVGPVFEQQAYGIGLRERSPLREEVNRALLAVKESGAYAELHEKWFGK